MSTSFEELAIRSQAIRRSWICPGAGLALAGHGPRAIATLLMAILAVLVLPWLAFQPGPTSLRTALAIVAMAGVLGLAEQVSLKGAVLQPPAPRILVQRFAVASLTYWLGAIAASLFLIASFGSLRVREACMAPGVEQGERLIYHKRVAARELTRNAVVLCRNSDDSARGQPGEYFLARILGGPGDQLALEDSHYIVNRTRGPLAADAGSTRLVIDVPAAPESLVVPDECYFVIQDSPAGADSRTLSWVRRSQIVSSRIWHFQGMAPLTPVK